MRLYDLQGLSCCFMTGCSFVIKTGLHVSLKEKLAPHLVDACCCHSCQSWHSQLLSLEVYLLSASLVRPACCCLLIPLFELHITPNMHIVESQHVVAERDLACSSKEPPLCCWCS